jgi:hypothetical protein
MTLVTDSDSRDHEQEKYIATGQPAVKGEGKNFTYLESEMRWDKRTSTSEGSKAFNLQVLVLVKYVGTYIHSNIHPLDLIPGQAPTNFHPHSSKGTKCSSQWEIKF